MFKQKLYVGSKGRLKSTSRINIWGKTGIISIKDSFSIGYNSELYVWDENLSIGTGTSINDNCKIYGNVTIGSNCLLASNIFISSGTHNFSYDPSLPIKVQDKLNTADNPIYIEDDCWIGFGVVVMPGIYIGKGAVIGANSVITKNVLPYTVNGGVPCHQIGMRLDFNQSYQTINSSVKAHWPFFYRGCNYRQFDEIETLRDGLEIINTSIFLLSKMDSQQLEISGICYEKMKLQICLNNETGKEIQIESGIFAHKLTLTIPEYKAASEFDQIPQDLRDNFNIIVIKSLTNEASLTTETSRWKVISVGLL